MRRACWPQQGQQTTGCVEVTRKVTFWGEISTWSRRRAMPDVGNKVAMSCSAETEQPTVSSFFMLDSIIKCPLSQTFVLHHPLNQQKFGRALLMTQRVSLRRSRASKQEGGGKRYTSSRKENGSVSK